MPWLYNDPETLDYNKLDEPIRNLCKQINASTSLRTEESCAGHFANEPSPSLWGGFSLEVISLMQAQRFHELYLRLVVISGELAKLLTLVDLIREGCSGLNWHVRLAYDRTDELGTHWYFTLDYKAELKYRDIAIDLVKRKFCSVYGDKTT